MRPVEVQVIVKGPAALAALAVTALVEALEDSSTVGFTASIGEPHEVHYCHVLPKHALVLKIVKG
jgi:hypothetical protein